MYKAKMLTNTRVLTGEVRASFAHVDKPAAMNEGQDPKYSLQIILSKDDRDTVDAIDKAIDNAIAAGVAKFGGKAPKKSMLKLPLRDGDSERDSEEYENCYFLNCSSKQAPQVVDKDRRRIDPSGVYSGCYVRVTMNFYAFSVNGNKGVAVYLGNVMFLRDGEPLGGGRASAADDFGAPKDEADGADDADGAEDDFLR